MTGDTAGTTPARVKATTGVNWLPRRLIRAPLVAACPNSLPKTPEEVIAAPISAARSVAVFPARLTEELPLATVPSVSNSKVIFPPRIVTWRRSPSRYCVMSVPKVISFGRATGWGTIDITWAPRSSRKLSSNVPPSRKRSDGMPDPCDTVLSPPVPAPVIWIR